MREHAIQCSPHEHCKIYTRNEPAGIIEETSSVKRSLRKFGLHQLAGSSDNRLRNKTYFIPGGNMYRTAASNMHAQPRYKRFVLSLKHVERASFLIKGDISLHTRGVMSQIRPSTPISSLLQGLSGGMSKHRPFPHIPSLPCCTQDTKVVLSDTGSCKVLHHGTTKSAPVRPFI